MKLVKNQLKKLKPKSDQEIRFKNRTKFEISYKFWYRDFIGSSEFLNLLDFADL